MGALQVRLPPALSRDSADGGLGSAIAHEAHFCCTLVVNPPGLAPDIGSAHLAACWGRPPPDAAPVTTGGAPGPAAPGSPLRADAHACAPPSCRSDVCLLQALLFRAHVCARPAVERNATCFLGLHSSCILLQGASQSDAESFYCATVHGCTPHWGAADVHQSPNRLETRGPPEHCGRWPLGHPGAWCGAGAARRAAKVLWLCATGVDGAGSPRLWLWAVDRLSGVTMNGAPALLPSVPHARLSPQKRLPVAQRTRSPMLCRCCTAENPRIRATWLCHMRAVLIRQMF